MVRRKYLAALGQLMGRNVIMFYSGLLQKRAMAGIEVNDADKNGFMTAVHGRDRSRPRANSSFPGETAATESLVDYLRSIFGNDIRAFVP